MSESPNWPWKLVDVYEAQSSKWPDIENLYDIQFKFELIWLQILKYHNRHNKSNLRTAMPDADINWEYCQRMDNVQ